MAMLNNWLAKFLNISQLAFASMSSPPHNTFSDASGLGKGCHAQLKARIPWQVQIS